MAKRKPPKPRSSGARSKNKGSTFERKICRQLSMWWAGRDDIFWRTAGSGAMATIRSRRNCQTANSAGDICALDQVGAPFTDHILVELKKGYTNGSERIDILKLLDSPNSKKSILLFQWWVKARKEMKFAKREEVWIIFERDRGKSILMTRSDYIQMLEIRQGLSYPYPMIKSCMDRAKFTFVVLEDFLNWYSPETVIL